MKKNLILRLNNKPSFFAESTVYTNFASVTRNITDMNIKELSQKRFSARKYTAEPVSREDIDYIMERVRMAPSAVNRQPWKFIIVSSEEARQKLWHTYEREWFRTAPLYIVCMKDNSECWTRPCDNKPHGDIDVAIATEHLCLAATERGLGTCWVCNFDTAAMHDMFPYDHLEAVAIIPVGHIADDCPHTEKRRKAMEDIVEEI